MATRKYAALVSKLFAGESIFLTIDSSRSPQAVHVALCKEKKLQENFLNEFDCAPEHHKLRMKKLPNPANTYQFYLEEVKLGFTILDEPPGITEDGN